MAVTDRDRRIIEQFRAGGTIEDHTRDRLLLLTTTGRRTGLPHTAPLRFHRDHNRILLVAANHGAPTHPAWYHNLVANPLVTVEIDHDTYQARATPATDPQRSQLWTMLKSLYPSITTYESKTTRTIPLIILQRVD